MQFPFYAFARSLTNDRISFKYSTLISRGVAIATEREVTVMAKSKMDWSMGQCQCGPHSILWMVLGAVAMGLGLWAIVSGIQMQWGGGAWLNTLLWYAVGFLLLGFGKSLKWKSCAHCAPKM